MRIYRDIITNDEMFTDTYKLELVKDCVYEVYCHHVTRRQGGDFVLEGANPSAEEAAEDFDDGSVQSGLDLVLNQRLVDLNFSKDDFKAYLKAYAKSLQDKWKKLEYDSDKIAAAKTRVMEAVKYILPKIDDNVKYFAGESSNFEGMIAVLEYRERSDGGEDSVMMFIKDGLEEEKV